MIFEFSNKAELDKIIEALSDKLSAGLLTLLPSETEPIARNTPNRYAYPPETKKFFERISSANIQLLNHVADPLFIKDKDLRWLFVNDAFCRFFAVAPEDIIGKTSHHLFPARKADIFTKQDMEVLRTGNPSDLEEIIVNKNGESRSIYTRKMLYTALPDAPCIVGIFHEITDLRRTESDMRVEKAELENRVKERTVLLTQTIHQLQEEIKNHKETERALSESEDKFRSLIEQSVEGIELVNTEGRIIEWNHGMESITGLKRAEVCGQFHWDVEFQLMKPGLRKQEFYRRLKSLSLETLSEQEINPKYQYIEGSILSATGVEKFIHLTLFGIKARNSFFIGRIARDITEQKKVAISLQRSEAHYRAIFENANDAILILDSATSEIISANEKAGQIYKYPVNQLIGMPLKKLTRNYAHDLQHLDNLKKNIASKNFETTHINADNEELNMLVNSSLIDYYGTRAIMNINHDITEIKKAEKARSATFQISQLIHNTSGSEDIYIGIHNVIRELMPARNFYIALQDEKSGLLYFPYFVDEKDLAPGPRKLRAGLTEYVLRSGNPVLLNPDLLKQLENEGEIERIGAKSVDWLGVPLNTHGKTIGVIAVQSYTQGIRYSVEQKDMLVFVSEQIASLIYKKRAEEDLIKSKITAEESDRLKSSLIANISHEIRTPMTGILGFASLLRQKITDETAQGMVDNILESGKRLMATLNSILQLSQLEAGNKPISIIRDNVNKYIELSLGSMEYKAGQKNIFLKTNFPYDVFALFNENFFIQAITNLVSNAIKFTDKGGITIETGYKNNEGTELAYIKIIDTGIGISKDHFKMIFEEFRQVSEGLNRTYEGTGLGLSVCKKMIQLMGGKISVESEVGFGSVFTITLPAAKTPAQESSVTGGASLPAESGTAEVSKILVVDDNRINAELIAAYLKKNAETSIATSGKDAVELCSTNKYDLILMDIDLGLGMSGKDAAAEIRKLKNYKKTPILAITGFTLPDEIRNFLTNDFNGHISKPIERKSLIARIQEVIKGS